MTVKCASAIVAFNIYYFKKLSVLLKNLHVLRGPRTCKMIQIVMDMLFISKFRLFFIIYNIVDEDSTP